MTDRHRDQASWPQADPVHMQDIAVPSVLGLFVGVALGVLVVVLALVSGVGRSDLPNPCHAANVAALVPEAPRSHGRGGRTGAHCATITPLSATPAYAAIQIDVTKPGPRDRAVADHRRGCAALEGLGALKRPAGIGDEACLTAESGWLRVVTVLARRGDTRISVRYATQAKDLATTERDTLEAARRVAARL